MKFAGDAIFAEWRVRGSPRPSRRKGTPEAKIKPKFTKVVDGPGKRQRMTRSNSSSSTANSSINSRSSLSSIRSKDEDVFTIEDCVHTAAVCGAAIVNKCADYPIFDASTT